MGKHVNIIGAGIAGLATAIRLAARGFQVTVFERNGGPGGKLGTGEWQGFRWDTGPSLFTLPDLVEELYVLGGEEMKTSVRCQKLEVITRYFWEDGTILDAYGEPGRFAREAELVLGEPAGNVLKYLDRVREIFDLTAGVFIFNRFFRPGTFLSREFLTAFLQIRKLDSMVTMHQANARSFRSERLVQLFDRYATYNGSDPFRAPGTLNVISHLEHNMGLFFPEKGMYSLATGLKELADNLGVIFHFNQGVEKVVIDRGRARGVVVENGIYPSDIVVSDIDIFYLYRDLLEDIPFPVRHFRKEKSTSALVFHWAVNRSFPELELHNIFFSNDYREEFRVMGQKQEAYGDPTIYLYISSKMARNDAPSGCENWFVMINAPENLGQDWDRLIGESRRNILRKLGSVLGTEIEPLIMKEFVTDPRSIEESTRSHRGALYGHSSNGRTAAFTRHPNFINRYRGLYFAGGSVHPGGGIPLCLASARIVDGLIGTKI